MTIPTFMSPEISFNQIIPGAVAVTGPATFRSKASEAPIPMLSEMIPTPERAAISALEVLLASTTE